MRSDTKKVIRLARSMRGKLTNDRERAGWPINPLDGRVRQVPNGLSMTGGVGIFQFGTSRSKEPTLQY